MSHQKQLSAAQQRALRHGYHVLKASNFAEYKGKSPDLLGHVLIFSFRGDRLAGPFNLETAERWLASAKLERLHGRELEGAA